MKRHWILWAVIALGALAGLGVELFQRGWLVARAAAEGAERGIGRSWRGKL